jgi:hypothetical protein
MLVKMVLLLAGVFNGRELTTESQPLPKGILNYLNHKADKYINKKLGPDKTETITIGKK